MRLSQFQGYPKIHDAPSKPFCSTVYIEGLGAIGFNPFVDKKVVIQIPLLNANIDNVRALKVQGDQISFQVDIYSFDTDRHTTAKDNDETSSGFWAMSISNSTRRARAVVVPKL